MIYAYEDKYDPNLKGLLKVGYTTIGVQERVRQQYNIVRPGEPPYRILVEESAMRQDGTAFMDHDVHRMLPHSVTFRLSFSLSAGYGVTDRGDG